MPPLTSPGFHQVRREVASVRPDLFLHLSAGGPRGFWASGDRWIAHCGVIGEVAVESDARDSGGSRFVSVQDRAGQVFSRIAGDGTGTRLFGGFSFSPRPNGDSVWSRFPPALFHLPEVELEHHPDRGVCTLVVRARDRGSAEDAWKRWAAALAGGTAALPAGRAPSRGGTRSLRGRASPLLRGAAPVRGRDQPLQLGNSQRPGTERAAWGRVVWESLSRIGAGEAEKVVLARTLDVTPAAPISPTQLVVALWEENHGSHVFLFEPTPGRAIVGAAPERIVTLNGGVFKATAVAGSAAVGADSVATAQLARRLFHSEKDRAEHDVVVRDMVARLSALGCMVKRDIEPHVLALARIQHLETKIAAEVPDGISVLDILALAAPHSGRLRVSAQCGAVGPGGERTLRPGLVFGAGGVVRLGGQGDLRARSAVGRERGRSLASVRGSRDRAGLGSGAGVGGDRTQVSPGAAGVGTGRSRGQLSRRFGVIPA